MSVTVDPLFVLGSSLEQSAQMMSIVDKTVRPKGKLVEFESSSPPHHHPPKRESIRISSLGGIENNSATHDIVTDAIEALLFDEIHTRETYHRHEKELSLSSLPGVIPISKQLFAIADEKNNDASAASIISANDGPRTKFLATNAKEEPSSSPLPPPRLVYTSSLEDVSRNNNSRTNPSSTTSFSSSFSRLRAVSPARMEAASALVSQSRNNKNETEQPYFRGNNY